MLATLAMRSFAAILLVAVSASLVHAQSDCLVNAGITPQEVCLADHISLGGNPTVPSALTTDVANIQWTVVTPGVDATFEPSANHPNPQVYLSQTTTFQVELTLNDGGSCTSQITLTPIEQPTLNLQGSWTQCSGSTELTFYNTSPSNNVAVHYNVDWGDGQTSDDIPYGSAFEHNYGTQGSYSVAVEAHLGSCTNSTTVDVFMGSAPDAPALNVPPLICPDGELSFSWDNLDNYPLGSVWQVFVDGALSSSGVVEESTETSFEWNFDDAEECLDALASHTIYAEVVNACLPSASSLANLNLTVDPQAEVVVTGDSCEVFQLDLGDQIECPQIFDVAWNVTQDGASVNPSTIAGGDGNAFWMASLPPGTYNASVQVGSAACGYAEDNASFCIEMTPPQVWGTPGYGNGVQIDLCEGESLDLWIDPLEAFCGADISTAWTLSALSQEAQLSSVSTLEAGEWSRSWVFGAPGVYLVELNGTAGCGELNLFAEVVVTDLPSLELVSYDDGMVDTVLCPGDEVSVVAQVSGYGLQNGAYDLHWSLLNDNGFGHPSASSYFFGDSMLVVQSSPSPPYDDIYVALEVSTACGPVYDTLKLTIEEPLSSEFSLLEGVEDPMDSGIPSFLQCNGDTLVMGFNAPGASEVNVYSQTLDLWNIVLTDGPNIGELHWLANGLEWEFPLEFVSEAGCTSYETVHFSTLTSPEIFVDDAGIGCVGDSTELEAVVYPGSSSSIVSINWYDGSGLLQSGLETTLPYTMTDCNSDVVTAIVTDGHGCSSNTTAFVPVNCPFPEYPEAISCGEPGDTVCVEWTSDPNATWDLPEGMVLTEDGLGTCVVVDSVAVPFALSWTQISESGCQGSSHACWSVAPLDANGECSANACSESSSCGDDAWTCTEPGACNYDMPSCCIDECLYPEDIGDIVLSYDTLTFCQTWSNDFELETQNPWIGTWSGPGVLDNSDPNCPGTSALLDLSTAGAWDIVFTGGMGSCRSTDTVHVIVHGLPSYDGPGLLEECHGTVLDLSTLPISGEDPCMALSWLGDPVPPCSSESAWTVNGSGYIAVTLTDANGCSSLNSSFYLNDLGMPNAIVGGDTTLCHQPLPNAMQFEFGAPYALGCHPAEGTWSGVGASYDLSSEVWSNGTCIQNDGPWIDSIWTFTPPGLGDFEWVWTVVDCNGCVDQDTITIHVVEPTAPVLPDPIFCMNDPVGLVTDQEGACWFGEGISPDFVFDPALAGPGTHQWSVGIGEGSCAVTDSIEIQIFENPEFELSGLGPWPCQDEPYSMCVDVPEEGHFPWSFEWSSFPLLEEVDSCTTVCCEVENVDATNVTALVTNVHGCSAEDSWVINLADTPEVQLADTLDFCNDGDWHLLPVLPPGGEWSGPKVTANGSFHANENGVFNLHYAITNDQECSDSDSLVIVVSDLASPSIATPPSEVCLGAPFSLITDDEGVWSGPGISSNGSIQQTVPGVATYFLTTGVGSCFAQDSVDITFLETPFVDLPVDTVLCAGNPIELDIDPSVIEAQNIISGVGFGCAGLSGSFPSYTYAPENTCDFSLVVQNDKGCLGVDNMNVIVPLPVPSYAGPSVVMCYGQEETLTGQIIPDCATSVVWTGDVVDSQGLVTANEVGLHVLQLTYTDCYGCQVSGQREVLVLDVPSVEFTWEDSIACAGQEVDALVTATGGGLVYEWLWSEGTNLPTPDTPWVAINEGISPESYELAMVATNQCGSDTSRSTITVKPMLLVSPTSALSPTPLVNDTLCAPVDLDFVADAPNASGWVWSDAMDVDTEDSSGASFSISSVEAPTDYELYVQAGLGETYCSSPLTWTLTVVPEPLAELTAESTLHCGESFDPGVMFSYEHGSPSWSWSGGELPASFPDSWTVDAYGDQVLTLAVSSEAAGADCVAEKPLDIGLHPQPVADFALVSDSVLCAPGRFEIQDLSQDAVEVTWFVEYVGGWISPGDVLPLLLPFDGSYDMLWVANGTGGCSDTLFEADVFTVLPSPDAGIWSNQPAYVPWSSEGTEFVFNDISVGGDSTIWTIGDSTIVDEDILNFFYEDPGLYALQQQVYNEFGCQDTVSFRFEIIDELAIYVPTAFTPNGDQLNDVWKPVMAGESRIDQYHLMVMGRSGQIMFDTHDYTKGWDAQNTKRTDKLEDVQNNVFTYQLRVLPSATPLHPDPDWLEYTGHVTIID